MWNWMCPMTFLLIWIFLCKDFWSVTADGNKCDIQTDILIEFYLVSPGGVCQVEQISRFAAHWHERRELSGIISIRNVFSEILSCSTSIWCLTEKCSVVAACTKMFNKILWCKKDSSNTVDKIELCKVKEGMKPFWWWYNRCLD